MAMLIALSVALVISAAAHLLIHHRFDWITTTLDLSILSALIGCVFFATDCLAH